MSHIPGPWTVSRAKPTKTRGIDILTDGGTACIVASVYRPAPIGEWNAERLAQSEATARLIAAAPDMLKALIKAREAIASFPRSMAYDITHLREIDAALGKATGSTTAVVGRDA